jgi:hypothetical protein
MYIKGSGKYDISIYTDIQNNHIIDIVFKYDVGVKYTLTKDIVEKSINNIPQYTTDVL